MEKLMSMREKVLQLESQLKRCISKGMPFTDLQALKQSIQTQIFLFANFLSQKLELWMFFPCKLVDGVWVVLEKPKEYEYACSNPSKELMEEVNLNYQIELKEYQEAKDRVLFEGFEYDKKGFAYSTTQSECGFDEEYMESKTIEDLVKYNLVLTETAKKQIGT